MIKKNVHEILTELPENVELVAAVKTRGPAEIREVLEAGIKKLGQNKVQEALPVIEEIGRVAEWHFIGHLQRNKVKQVVPVFDLIESVDSFQLAQEIDKQCAKIQKIMPVLIQLNSGRELQKYGVLPKEAEALARKIAAELPNIKIQGLMTMGPLFGEPEKARPYFTETKRIFEHLKKLCIPRVEMKYLSMGMSSTYRVAIEEGANIIRIGTRIFGERS